MRNLLWIAILALTACQNGGTVKADNAASLIRLRDSFYADNRLITIEERSNSRGDSFSIVCRSGDDVYLNYSHPSPSEFIRTQHITNNRYPDIVVDDCIADEFGGLLIFKFNPSKNKYEVIAETAELSSEFYKLSGTNLYYDFFCFNQSGCQSTLFRFEEYSCVRLASLYIPYNSNQLQYRKDIKNSAIEIVKAGELQELNQIPGNFWKSRYKSYQ